MAHAAQNHLFHVALLIAMAMSHCALASAPIFHLTDLGGLSDSKVKLNATGINNDGQVVGSSSANVGAQFLQHAFLWTPASSNGTSGSMIDIGLLPDPQLYDAEAQGINDIGQVTGRNSNANYQRVFLWTPGAANGQTGSMVDLGNPAGPYNQ